MLYCGAPLRHLPGKQQAVKILWKGKPYKKIIFKENKAIKFSINGKAYDEGFLGLRIDPVFNLKALDLGPEGRTLGVQFFKMEKVGKKGGDQ